MKKVLSLILIFSLCLLCACGPKEDNGPASGSGNTVSFEAYVTEGETFTFELDPRDAVSYFDLRAATSRAEMDSSNWDSFFEVREVYREHTEYDDAGDPTQTYAKGTYITVGLKDQYYYADNWSRNGLEFRIWVDGTQTRVMTNEGTTYDPVTEEIREARNYYGADIMLILTDFVDSWDEQTVETYSGTLNEYEILDAKGSLYLLDASVIEFRDLGNGIKYFAAYDSPGEYYVIFLQTDDAVIDREKEYDGAVYAARYGETYRYTGYDKIVLWEMVTDLMDRVDSTNTAE